MYQNKYKNTLQKKQKEQQNSGKKPKPKQKPEWNSSTTDENKYKLSAAEIVQRKVAHVSKHRFQAKEEWQQRQKKLQEGVLDEETSKIYETARESKNLNSGKYDRQRRNLSQMIDYNKSFLSSNNNSEMFNTNHEDFEQTKKNYTKVNNPIQEDQQEDFISDIQQKVLQTREFIKKMEACKCNTEDPKQVIKAQEHAVSKTLQFQRKKQTSATKSSKVTKVNNFVDSKNSNSKSKSQFNDENYNDSNFISNEQQGLKEVEQIKKKASKHMEGYFNSLAKIEDTIKFMENNIINSDKKQESKTQNQNQTNNKIPDIQNNSIQKNDNQIQEFSDKKQKNQFEENSSDKQFLLKKIQEIEQQEKSEKKEISQSQELDSPFNDFQQKLNEQKLKQQQLFQQIQDSTLEDNSLSKKIDFDNIQQNQIQQENENKQRQQQFQNKSPQKQEIHGILKNKNQLQQNQEINDLQKQFGLQENETEDQYSQFQRELMEKHTNQPYQQQQQQNNISSYNNQNQQQQYQQQQNHLYNNDQSEVREVSILDDDDLDMNKIRDMLENTKRDLEQLNNKPSGLEVPQLSFMNDNNNFNNFNNNNQRLNDITNVQSQQDSNLQNMFVMKKNPQEVIQLNTSHNNASYNNQFKKLSSPQNNIQQTNNNNNFLKNHDFDNEDEEEEGPRNFNIIQQNQFHQQVQQFEKKNLRQNDSLSLRRYV